MSWKIEKWDGPQDYWLATTGDNDQPGINGALTPRAPGFPGIVNTIGVASLKDVVSAVEPNGGEVIEARIPVPGVGLLAYVKDSEGNIFGLMQPDPDSTLPSTLPGFILGA